MVFGAVRKVHTGLKLIHHLELDIFNECDRSLVSQLFTPNISINLVTKLVANKKNMKCFGAETIQDLYDVIATYESEE